MPAMPAMNMPEMRNNAELKWTGSEYTGPIQIMMAGGWNVVLWKHGAVTNSSRISGLISMHAKTRNLE